LDNRPIAIDLFAGAGGLSLGLEQAGFDVVAAVEIDPIHACVHKYNFPQWVVITRAIENINGKYIREAAGLREDRQIDLVAGGAPCQGFSLIGQRALDDPRNQLVKEYIRIVKDLRPSYFVFENVKGLTIGNHKKFLNELINELESIGYNVLKPWQVLNAKDYGIPQNRERLFLIGAKEGMNLPSYPLPTTPNPVTCEEALGDLPDAEEFEDLLTTDETTFRYLRSARGYSELTRCISEA
jgi:DNA (cytosine-5)-methyltransferase 1